MSKDKATFRTDLDKWVITYVDSKGDTKTRDGGVIPPVAIMDEGKAVEALQGLAKDSGNLRRAAMTLLAKILEFGGTAVAEYKGQVKPTENLPAEMKKTMQSAEEGYFKQYLDPKHVHHKSFMARLPKENERGEALEVGGKLNQERQFQYFLTAMRQGSSYSNAKNVALSFWAYCGQGPMSADGKTLVPPEVMRVMVAEVKIVTPADTSIKGRLHTIRREAIAESKAGADDDIPEVVATLRELLLHYEQLQVAAAQRATIKARAGDVVQTTKDAITQANQKMKPADAPSAQAQKETTKVK